MPARIAALGRGARPTWVDAPLRGLLVDLDRPGGSPAEVRSRWRNRYELGGLLLLSAGLALSLGGDRWASALARVSQPADPAALGGLRLVVFGVLAADQALAGLPDLAGLPPGLDRPLGVMDWPGVASLAAALRSSAPALAALQWAGVVVGVLAAVGWRFRVTGPAALALALLAGGLERQVGYYSVVGMLPRFLAALLVVLPGAGTWPIRLRSRTGAPAPAAARDGWSLTLIVTMVAAVYVSAGVAKLRNGGLAWFDAGSQRRLVVESLLMHPVPYPLPWDGLLLLGLPDAVVTGLALAVVALELAAGLMVVSRRARVLIPPLLVGFHLAVLVLQHIHFWDALVLLPALTLAAGRGPRSAGPAAPAAVPGPERRARRGAAAVTLLLGVMAAIAWARLEAYPLTAWQMYSASDRSGRVRSIALWGRTAAGAEAWLDPEATWPGLGRGRWREAARRALERPEAVGCALLRYGLAHAAPGIVALELRESVWDLRSEPGATAAPGSLRTRLILARPAAGAAGASACEGLRIERTPGPPGAGATARRGGGRSHVPLPVAGGLVFNPD